MRKILIFLLCFCTIFVCFVIPSFADDGMITRAVPTDLTGYTVTVPSGWTATRSLGQFSVDFSLKVGDEPSLSCSLIAIGYTFDWVEGSGFAPASNYCTVEYDNYYYSDLSPDYPLEFVFTGGSHSGNSTLIQWLVDSGATFEGGSAPETSSISGGIYHFKKFGDLPDIPDAGWTDGEGYTYSYSVAGKMVTTSRNHNFTTFNVTFDEYVSNSYYTVTFSVDTDVGTLNLATYTASYGQVTLVQREGFKYIVFDEALIGTYDDIEFIRDFLVSGLPSGDTSPTDNPWLYILDMIIEALKVDLFGYFSVWDIFTTMCGIFIVTWLLKLLAGG